MGRKCIGYLLVEFDRRYFVLTRAEMPIPDYDNPTWLDEYMSISPHRDGYGVILYRRLEGGFITEIERRYI